MTHPALCRRGALAAGRTAVRSFTGILAASLLLAPASCRKTRVEPTPDTSPALSRGDALFLAEAPAFVPDDIDAELGSMQIVRLYVPAATLSRSGAVKPLPPPPTPLKRPLVLTVLGEEGAAASVAGRGEAVGAEWARSLAPILENARSWGQVEGIHFHLWPSPDLAKDLGAGARRGPPGSRHSGLRHASAFGAAGKVEAACRCGQRGARSGVRTAARARRPDRE